MEHTLDLCEQLALTDLTEEDTETLLEEATELNKRLRAELRRIEEKESAKRNIRSSPVKTSKNNAASKRLLSQSVYASSNSAGRPSTSFLPPISSSAKSPGNHKSRAGATFKSSTALKTSSGPRHVSNVAAERQCNSAGVPTTKSSPYGQAANNRTSHSADAVRGTRNASS